MSLNLLELARVISDSAANVAKTYQANGTPLPSLDSDAPYTVQPEVLAEAAKIVAAAQQLTVLMRPPDLTLVHMSINSLQTAALGVASRLHLAERLREGNPQGVSVTELANACNVDQNKLARIIRLLVTNGVFREPKPDVFANNSLSLRLDSGKSLQEILSSPETKHDSSNAGTLSRWLAFNTDEVARAAAYLPDMLADNPKDKTAFNFAFNTDSSYKDWLFEDGPDQLSRRGRQAAFAPTSSMAGGLYAPGSECFLDALKGKEFSPDSIVVGVSAGSTQTTLHIAKSHPGLQYIIQDSSKWNNRDELCRLAGMDPTSLAAGKVQFQVHNIIDKQPFRDVRLFVCNDLTVFHYSTREFSQALREFRKAAAPDCILLISTFLANPHAVPKSLLGNNIDLSLVEYEDIAFKTDLATMALWDSEFYTIERFSAVLAECGWQVTKVFRTLFLYAVVQAVCSTQQDATKPSRPCPHCLQLCGKYLQICETNGTPIPSLDSPSLPLQPELLTEISKILAAARQLTLITRPGDLALLDIAAGSLRTAALGIALRLHLTERLREGNPEGVNIADLAQSCSVDQNKLARVLRSLGSNGVFRETQPGVFANSNLSLSLDSGKPLQDLLSNPQTKYDGANAGFVSRWLDIATDEVAKAAPYLPDMLIDNPNNRTGLQIGFDTGSSYRDWLFEDGPDQLYRRRRRAAWAPTAAMSGGLYSPGFRDFSDALDGKVFPPDSIAVGTGVGSTQAILEIAKVFPDLQYTIQDLSHWNSHDEVSKFAGLDKATLASGRVRFQDHNTLEPQPLRNISLFVVNDLSFFELSTSQFAQALREYRKAAAPDCVLLTAIFMEPSSLNRIPKNLLGNDLDPSVMDFGDFPEQADLATMATWDAELFTFERFSELLGQCGWKITKVFRTLALYVVIQAVCK